MHFYRQTCLPKDSVHITALCCAFGLLTSAVQAPAEYKSTIPEPQRYTYEGIGDGNYLDFPTGGHWFNCGPTGIRASIENDRPSEFLVQYVFPGSPADKKVLIGDRIVGANGKRWTEEDLLKQGQDKSFGYYGPRRMLGLAIEESEAKKGAFSGTLSIIIMRAGKQVDAKVFLDRIGEFSPNFPFDCEKSQLLIDNAAKFLLEHADQNHHRWRGHWDSTYMALLGLLAQGDKHKSFIRDYIDANYDKLDVEDDSGDWTWTQAMRGIMAAELYLATKDKRIIPFMEYHDKWLSKSATPWGAYEHHPFIGIGKGYGPMAHPTALACTAWAMFKKCGVKIDEEAYMRSRHLLDFLTGPSGELGYGAGLPEGVAEVPAKFDLKRGKTEDSGPWRSFGATGYSTMFHFLDPMESYSDYYVQRGVKAAAYCKELIPDGHAKSSLSLWAGFMTASLAPAVGRNEVYREFCDYYKAWLNVNRCHDGSFYSAPNRDVNQDGYSPSTRINPTGAVLLLLSAPKRNLYILGKNAGNAAAPPASKTKTSVKPVNAAPAREARLLKPDSQEILDKSLKSALAKLSAAQELKPVPLAISLTRSRVWLKSIDDSGQLTFQIAGGNQTAAFSWKDLTHNDRSTLSLLLANLKPDSSDAQAMAGMYMETIGKVDDADRYFHKAGDASRQKLESLFE